MTNQLDRIKTASLVGCLAALVTLTPMTGVRAQTGRVERPERQSVRPPPAIAVQPGFSLGLSLGIEGLGGSAHRSVQPGGSADLFVRYGTSFGLSVQAGGQFSTHGIDSTPSSIKAFGFYIEPRFILLNVSSRWAPFVAGRLAFTREAADGNRIAFEASGYSLGGGGGAIYRLTSQLALEGGLSVGLLAVGDYVFKGDYVTYQCMEGLEPGTPLPESVVQCGGLVSGLPAYNCYPPFYERLSGDCAPPGITRVNSRRSGPWYRLWFGIHLSLGSS